MLEAWLSAVMLAVESSEVVSLRLMKISQGGGDAYSEAALMLREKFAAASKRRGQFGAATPLVRSSSVIASMSQQTLNV
jgi:hypothetical protein